MLEKQINVKKIFFELNRIQNVGKMFLQFFVYKTVLHNGQSAEIHL